MPQWQVLRFLCGKVKRGCNVTDLSDQWLWAVKGRVSQANVEKSAGLYRMGREAEVLYVYELSIDMAEQI